MSYARWLQLGSFRVSTTVTTSWLIIAVLAIVSYFLTRNLKKVPTSKVQIFLEYAVITLKNLVTSTMGEKAVKQMPNMVPYIGSLFVFFVCSNLIGLLGFRSPTTDLDTTLAFSLITVFLIYYGGIKDKGLSYLKGFLDPIPLMLPMNIVSEVARPISLSFRPFGNILGGAVIMSLIYQFLGWLSTLVPGVTIPFAQLAIPVPLHLYFDLFAGVLQSFIFVMLTMVFVSNATD
ncbi:ATP synthase F0 subunit A [Romboutsia ilealis]|uniref:ATP synthase subunit a n=1 Tax=Romboutsia faecis TaxID=2764597 RepID=A0ABR7JTE1_9FIRM|nr:F0F1 ATP synthase subunit A [Romboutsia faecis]MBC5998047.1 F0F1 ATP synthase subunit A [Romboutsia faecis]MRN25738.1 ATP synthase F0 subunit A [Romboutsia ilealis]